MYDLYSIPVKNHLSVNFEQGKLKKSEKKSFSATKLTTNLYSSMKQKKSMNLQKYLAIDQASLFYAFSKKIHKRSCAIQK